MRLFKKKLENTYTPKAKGFVCVMSSVFPIDTERQRQKNYNDVERCAFFTTFNFDLIRQFRQFKLNDV